MSTQDPGVITGREPLQCGVYTLHFHGFVTYIGQSANLPQRLKRHISGGFTDLVTVEPCDPGELDALEGERIHAAHPPLNMVCPVHCGHYGQHRGRTQLLRLGLVPVPCMWRYGFRTPLDAA